MIVFAPHNRPARELRLSAPFHRVKEARGALPACGGLGFQPSLSDSTAHAPSGSWSLLGWWQLRHLAANTELRPCGRRIRIGAGTTSSSTASYCTFSAPWALGCPWLFRDAIMTIQILVTVSHGVLMKGLVPW